MRGEYDDYPDDGQGPDNRGVRVLDLDEDGFDSLTQFGMRMQAV
jgi:hypothetical protein